MNRPVFQPITLFVVLLIASTQIVQSAGGGVNRKLPATALDSLRVKSHEKYFEELYNRQPRAPMMVPPRPNSTQSDTFPNIDLSRDVSPQNEPSVRISHKDPNRMVAAWRDFRTGSNPAVRRIGYSFSTDGGATWGGVNLLPQIYVEAGFTRHSDPAVCVDTAGNFYIATVSLNDNDGDLKLIVFKSDPDFDVFDQAYFVPTDTAPNFYDKEYIVCDLEPASPYVNNLYMAWSGPNFSRSTDGGVTWSHAISYSDPNIGGNFAPDICVCPDGGVCVSSLGGSIIEFDRSTDGGQSFGQHKAVDTLTNGGSVNPPGFTSIAADLSNGPRRGSLYLVWSDAVHGDLDVYLSYSRDNGASWSAPRRVNDDPLSNGKEQFWPWVAVDDRGVVSIVYSDTRNTPSLSVFDTWLAYSWDGGITFTNRPISTASSTRNTPNGAVRFGDYIGLDSWGKRTVPVWTDERFGGFDMSIYTATLDTLPRAAFSGVSFNTREGWNLLSLPVLPSGQSAASVFPAASAGPLAYDTAYHLRTSVDAGPGYWVRYDSARGLTVTGDTLTGDSVAVSAGWNLVGSVTNAASAASVTSTPPGIIVSSFFGYDGSYEHASTIEPGKGYWVKTSAPGSLFISSAPSPQLPRESAADDLAQFNRLTLTGRDGRAQRLYAALAAQVPDPRTYELPPVPPEGSFDVRFATGRMVETVQPGRPRDVPIRIASGSYPLTLRWNVIQPGVRAELRVDGANVLLGQDGGTTLQREPSELTLRLSAEPGFALVPHGYALAQNYPNPFNPETRISYTIPASGLATLKIYDIIGREVATLVNETKAAGSYNTAWNAAGFPSGVYTYRLRVVPQAGAAAAMGTFSETKKMLLAR